MMGSTPKIRESEMELRFYKQKEKQQTSLAEYDLMLVTEKEKATPAGFHQFEPVHRGILEILSLIMFLQRPALTRKTKHRFLELPPSIWLAYKAKKRKKNKP